MVSPPNNLGATLLIVLGLITAPVGIGIVLLVAGLAHLRQANGRYSFRRLHGWRRSLKPLSMSSSGA